MTLRAVAPDELGLLTVHLRRYALVRLRDPAQAEDVVQEALVAALGAGARFEGRSRLRTWLTAILNNKIADHLRGVVRTRAVMVSRDEVQAETDEEGAAIRWQAAEGVDHASDPGRVLAARQALADVARDLDRLPRRSAAAFVMSDIEGFGTREVCDELDLSPANLWVVLHRARKAIRGGPLTAARSSSLHAGAS